MFDISQQGAITDEERRQIMLRKLLAPQLGQGDALTANAPTGLKRLMPSTPNFNPGVPAWRSENPSFNLNPSAPAFNPPQQAWKTANGIKQPGATVEMQDMAETVPALRGSRKTYADAVAHDDAPMKEEKGFWRRLGSGLLKGARAWGESGGQHGIGGLIGAVASGGITSGISPKTHAEWSKERKSGQLWNKHGVELKKEGLEMERMQEISKTQKASLEVRHKAAEPYIKSVMEKGYLDPGEVDHIKNAYGVDVADPNNGRFVTEERNGKTYIRRINDPNFGASNLPLQQVDVPYGAQVPGTDQVVPAKPGQILSTAVGVTQANAGREQRASEFTTRREDAAQDDAMKYQTSQNKARADRAAAATRLKELESSRQRAINDGEGTSAIDARIADAKGDIASADTLLKQKPLFDPKRISSGKGFTESDARQYYKSKGKTPAEIETLIQTGRTKGIIR